MTRRRGIRIDGGSLPPGLDIRGTSLGRKCAGVLSYRLAQRECLGVVIREEFRLVVAFACQLLDPLGGGQVFGGSVAAADLGVRHVPRQGVTELELDLALNRRASYPLQQLFPLEAVQQFLSLPGTPFRQRADRTGPAGLTNHRSILD